MGAIGSLCGSRSSGLLGQKVFNHFSYLFAGKVSWPKNLPAHYWKPVRVGNTASRPLSYGAAVTNYTAGRQRQTRPITQQDKCFRSPQTSRTYRAYWQIVPREIAPWLTSARASAAAHQSNPFPNCNVNLGYPLRLRSLNLVPWQTSLNLIHQTSLQMSLC